MKLKAYHMEPIVHAQLLRCIPHLKTLVKSAEMKVYYIGGNAFGYPQTHHRHEIVVVHGKTLWDRTEMKYPDHPDIAFDVKIVPRSHVIGMFSSGLGKLIPMGELVYDSGGKRLAFIDEFLASEDYAEVLKRKLVLNATEFVRTQNTGLYYMHMYADLVAYRTKLAGIQGVGECVDLRVLAGQYSANMLGDLVNIIDRHTSLSFEEFYNEAIASLKDASIEVIHPE